MIALMFINVINKLFTKVNYFGTTDGFLLLFEDYLNLGIVTYNILLDVESTIITYIYNTNSSV